MEVNSKQAKARDIVVLALVLVLAFCVCSLPSFLYYAIIESGTTDEHVPANCTGYQSNATANCSSISWGESYANGSVLGCSAEHYTGSACSDQLTAWQECALGRADNVYVNMTAEEFTQEEMERNAAQFLYFLQSFGSEACQRATGMFACQSFFPLCNCENGLVYEASREECERLSVVECEEEWNSAQQYGIQLPICDSLSTETSIAALNSSLGSNVYELPPLNLTDLTCREDFFLQNFTCIPQCYQWEQRPHPVTLALQTIRTITATVQLCASVILVATFIIRYKTILVFPTVILMYIGIGLILNAIFSIISAIGNTALYCSSLSVIETVDNPTTYCTVEGAIALYLLMNIFIWWTFHISFIFYKIVFPMHALKSQKHFKWVHLGFVCIAILVPTILVTFILVLVEIPYTTLEFPPYTCVNEQSTTFFVVVVLNLLMTLGIFMLIIIGWIIHKKRNKAAEKKMLLLLLYYILFVLIVLVQIEVSLSLRNLFEKELHNYFLCEATGHVPEKCNEDSFQQYITLPILESLRYVFLMLFPVIHLLFVIKFSDLKEGFRQLCQKDSVH